MLQPVTVAPVLAPTDCVWIYYQNVRGVRTKIDDLLLAATDSNYDVIILTETGLSDCIDSLQIFGSSYNVFRCDRSRINSNKTTSGGVLIAVHHRHTSTLVRTRHGEILEQVFVKAMVGCNRLLIGAVYIPPDRSRDPQLMDEHVTSVNELCDHASFADQVLICGDYNQPRLQWCESTDGKVLLADTSVISSTSATLLDGMEYLHMTQANWHRNEYDHTLDLVFCSSNCNTTVDIAAAPLLPIDPPHPPLEISVTVQQTSRVDDRNPFCNERILNFGKINYGELRGYLSTVDWDCLNACQNVNDMAASFCSIIQQWLQMNVPSKRRPFSPAWGNPLLRELKLERNACQRKHRVLRSSDSKIGFQRASKAYRKLNSAYYKAYVMKMQFNLRRNPKSFWKFVNSKRKYSTVPCNVVLDDVEAKSSAESCELFANFFASVFDETPASELEAESAASDVPMDCINLTSFVVTPAMVISAAKKLKISNSSGPDGIPSVMFCRCAFDFAAPLAAIFTRSLNDGVFPEVWKQSFMFPASNLATRETQSISYISNDQHGFMPGRSVTTNLLDFTSTCITAMENKTQVDVIYTDLKAAFDKIDHNILLAKLSRLESSSRLLSWI
ncbi:uncharacterized protein LOC129728762 [Wyeomyia smithii]|uniref:uncharacterized protein LOC129728762 n=1 Tax=Wyeomyia smithii TaxID=174621 RepID=UPI0024681A6F|nr:uncharacterized protein LOC129728762 [Wyeomyia smithii]